MSRRLLAIASLLVGCARTDITAVRCPEGFSEGLCASAATERVCGMQLGTSPVVFCETFDAPSEAGARAADLDASVWSVARMALTNFGQTELNLWNPTTLETCDGATPGKVLPPNDVVICNGQLREASNDAGSVTTLAMTVKQPFDFSGRTGTVSFDVANDSAGTHSAWPTLWMSNVLLPAPFNHQDTWQALPPQGLAIRLAAAAPIGSGGTCQNFDNLDKLRWTVDSVAVVRDHVLDDTNGYGPRQVQLTQKDCVLAPAGPGEMNHVEVRISQARIEVWASDAGVAATADSIKLIAELTDVSLGFTRGFISLEDTHFDADGGPTDRPSQREHTFVWDNVAFDGPLISPDLGYDALDDSTPGPAGTVNLAKYAIANETTSWDVSNVPADRQASSARVLFNFYDEGVLPTVLNVIVNGHAHATAWPYPDARTYTWRTLAVTIGIEDLVTGTNTVQLGADASQAYGNVTIALLPN